jgi:lysophospholipase L1-like esterase
LLLWTFFYFYRMRYLLSILGFTIIYGVCAGQDPQRFTKEVQEIVARTASKSKQNPIVFTGSSSIRLWSDLEQRFPEFNVINTGFGGSQTSEMFYFAEELIVGQKPKQVFIYEGDNDLGEGKTADQIIRDSEKLVNYLRGRLSKKVEIIFITPKPSIRRWHLKSQYEDYISRFKRWTSTQKKVKCVDVWTPMLDSNGELMKDLFLDDNLHMNSKGYDIWTAAIRPYLKKKWRK